jgi:hypothetical protein
MAHIFTILGLPVKLPAQFLDRCILTLADMTHGVEQLLGRKMVAKHFAVIRQVDQYRRDESDWSCQYSRRHFDFSE